MFVLEMKQRNCHLDRGGGDSLYPSANTFLVCSHDDATAPDFSSFLSSFPLPRKKIPLIGEITRFINVNAVYVSLSGCRFTVVM